MRNHGRQVWLLGKRVVIMGANEAGLDMFVFQILHEVKERTGYHIRYK